MRQVIHPAWSRIDFFARPPVGGGFVIKMSDGPLLRIVGDHHADHEHGNYPEYEPSAAGKPHVSKPSRQNTRLWRRSSVHARAAVIVAETLSICASVNSG